jgi:hypothetical protein
MSRGPRGDAGARPVSVTLVQCSGWEQTDRQTVGHTTSHFGCGEERPAKASFLEFPLGFGAPVSRSGHPPSVAPLFSGLLMAPKI